MKKRVMIGMSGGVDSSVAAYLLKEQGYDVIGVTMKLWQDDDDELIENEGGCCSLAAVEDARRVADRIGIPFYVLNFSDVFKQKVIEPFIDEYLNGRTPNPCIACNKHIKFDDFFNKARQIGCDYVATGHYAKIEKDEKTGRYLLKKSVTDKKDQTYALYNLTQEQLAHTLMPVGEYTKDEIRKIFNRFYKGENSLNPTSIGIGLSLSRKIIEAHNGTITVESQLNKGTTFYITFLKGII